MTPPPPLDVRSLRKQLNPGGMNSAHLMLGFSLVSQNITALGWVVSKRCASSALFPAAPLQMTIRVLQLFFLDRRKSSVWSWFVLCGWLVLVLQRELALLGSLRGPTRWTSGVSEELLDETLVFCSGAGVRGWWWWWWWWWGGGGGEGWVGVGGQVVTTVSWGQKNWVWRGSGRPRSRTRWTGQDEMS